LFLFLEVMQDHKIVAFDKALKHNYGKSPGIGFFFVLFIDILVQWWLIKEFENASISFGMCLDDCLYIWVMLDWDVIVMVRYFAIDECWLIVRDI